MIAFPRKLTADLQTHHDVFMVWAYDRPVLVINGESIETNGFRVISSGQVYTCSRVDGI